MFTSSANLASVARPKLPALLHRIGRYELIAKIGNGGMADVYLAMLAGNDGAAFQKLVVVKLIRSELSAEPEFIEMFMDEARVAGRLNHPNVIQTLEVGADAGRHYLAMEYVDGQPVNRVARVLLRHPGFDLSARLTIVLRTLLGLHHAHELTDFDGSPLGIVHRDVSPANILVSYDGQIKLTDFGIAKANDSSSQTRVGFLKGKAAYMAPEQARSGSVDRRADIYAAGVVMWELIAGRRLWGAASHAEILTRAAAGDIVPPSHLSTLVPPELDGICMKALAPKREERYATAAQFASDLESFVRRQLNPKDERDVGRLLVEACAEDRARVRKVLDQQLSWRSRGGTAARMQTVADLGTQATVRMAIDGQTPSYIRTPSQTPTPPTPTTNPAGPEGPPRPPEHGDGTGGGQVLRRRHRRLAIGGGAGLLVAGAIVLLLGHHPQPSLPIPARPNVPSLPDSKGPQPAQQGVSPGEITLGMSAVFSGPSRQLGENMKLGLETAFAQVNAAGGVNGRKLRLIALDDGYEAGRAGTTMTELLDQRRVFAVIGNVGTPTSTVAAPIASRRKTIFFGAFTGAPVLRQDPPDRYVFNYRASYREETAASLRYLAVVQKIPVDQIVVFAQEDSFGDAGYEGVQKAVRALERGARDVLRVGYKRNTTDIDGALAELVKYHQKTRPVRHGKDGDTVQVAKHPVRAIVMVATYRAAARFIQAVHQAPAFAKGKPMFLNVSFVGTEALADDLKGLDPGLCPGVYVTQVVPPSTSGATGVRHYREALAAFQPQAQPGFVSLEGYIVGSLFAEALKRTGPQLTTERLVDALEQFDHIDLGFGAPLSFSLSEHQGSHKVWGTRLDETCTPQAIELD